MPTSSGRVWLSTGLTDKQPSKSSGSLSLGSQSSGSISSQQGSAAPGRLQHGGSTPSGSSKWCAWTGSALQPSSGLKAASPTSSRVLHSSGLFTKAAKVTTTPFDSALGGTSPSIPAAGRRSTSVPRSPARAVFDAAWTPTQTAASSRTFSHTAGSSGSASSSASQLRSSSTGRSSRITGMSSGPTPTARGTASTITSSRATARTAEAGSGSFSAVPGRARVVGGRGLQSSNISTDTLGLPGGLAASKISSSTGQIHSDRDTAVGTGSTSISSSGGRSLQRIGCSGSSAAVTLHSQQPFLCKKLPAAGGSWGPATTDAAARRVQAVGDLHVQHSQQPTVSSSSSYLVRLNSQRAATAGVASSSYSPAGAPAGSGSGSIDAVGGRRVSSANAANITTSSGMQQALEKLRAGRMRPRLPTQDSTMAAQQHPAAPSDVQQPTCVALPGSPSSARTHTPAAAVAGSMGFGQSSQPGAQLQQVEQEPSHHSDSAIASLTALLERHKSERQQAAAAAAGHHPADQEVVPRQQRQPPIQQPQEQQGCLAAPTRRATDGGYCGPGERLEFPAATQQPQQQDPTSPWSRSKSGSYLDVMRNSSNSSSSSSAASGRPLQQQVSAQPAAQSLLRQQQQQQGYHVQQYQPLLQNHSKVLPPPSAATQRHGVHATSSSVYSIPHSSSTNASTAQVYKPPYVPPGSTATTAVVPPDTSSSMRPHHALAMPAAATAVPGACGFSRQQGSSSWSTAGSEAAAADRQDSHSCGSPAQQHALPQPQYCQLQPTPSNTGQQIQESSASGTQQGCLISTQPLAEQSSTRDATPAAGAAAGVGDAALGQLAAGTGVDQQAAAARRAFVNCRSSSSSSSSECPEAQSDSRHTAAMAATHGTSSRQRPGGWERDQQVAADSNRPAVLGARRVFGRADSSTHEASNLYVAADAAPDSDSDVSEMSSSLSSGSECSVEVAVEARSHRQHVELAGPPSLRQQQQQEVLYGDDTIRRSPASPAYARRSSLVGSPAGVAAGAASPASARQVPVKAVARSLSTRLGGLPRGCCGIRNQGNTCYQNSALQLLACVPELVGVLLGPQAAQLFQEAAADAVQQLGRRSRVTRGLAAAAAAAAQEGIDWRPGAAVGPALQALVGEMWGFQQNTQTSRQQRGSPSQTVQRSLQHQQQLQRVTQCMAELRCAMAESDPRWDDGDQWDCQEFCLALLQTVHADSNRVRGKPQYRELKLAGCEAQQAAEAAAYARSWEDSVVLDIFSWQLQSTLTCCACGKASHAFDSAQELLVAIPPGSDTVTVQECLARTTFSPEQMVGAEGYKCEACKGGLREATKQLQLFSYPQVLLLGLKRFETRGGSKGGNRAAAETYSSRKVTTRVRLDAGELLDLSPFCNPAGLKAAAAAGRPPPHYELIAVADHTGYIHGGHYTARGRALLDGSWVEFNDSLVLATEAPAGSTREGYMMLYRLVG